MNIMYESRTVLDLGSYLCYFISMKRKVEFAVDEYYHIFNRGIEKRNIFYKKKDYERFLRSLVIFNTKKSSWKIYDLEKSGVDFKPTDDERLVDIVAYCLNPNHFHLILKEKTKGGISTFMKKVGTGYAMYFNKKNERSGILFQGRFKSIHLSSNNLLLYVSAYINCNSEVHGIEKAEKYPWCSFSEYLGSQENICQKNDILKQFKNPLDYKEFCLEKVIGMKEKKRDGNACIEE